MTTTRTPLPPGVGDTTKNPYTGEPWDARSRGETVGGAPVGVELDPNSPFPIFAWQNWPDPADVVALARNPARLEAFLGAGYQRMLDARTKVREQGHDPTDYANNLSNVEIRERMIRMRDFFWVYGPTLLLVLDQVALDGRVAARGAGEQV